MVRGLVLLWRDMRLRAMVSRMVWILLALIVLAAVGGFALTRIVERSLMPPETAWYAPLLGFLLGVLALLVGLLLALMLYMTLAGILVAPLIEPMVRHAAALRGERLPDDPPGGALRVVWRAASNSVRPLLHLLLCGVGALLLWWVPLVGPLLAAAVWTLGSMRYLCFELIDARAALLGWGYGRRREELRHHAGYWIGAACMATALLLVPLLNLLVLPAAAVGLRRPRAG